MNSAISHGITLAEEQWLGLVRPHVTSIFSTTFLPSHDQTHHQRVWEICKSLLLELEKFHSVADQDVIEALLLASWFHDSGMAIDPGEKHGSLGGEIFETFIGEQELKRPLLYTDILEAIVQHDSKERDLYGDLIAGESPGILGLLSAADDLDALGFVGIYRYSEIYLKRGTPADQLGILVLANVRKRFKNIRESFVQFPGLIDGYLEKYGQIEAFFNRYNQFLLLEQEIILCIRSFSLEYQIRPEDFFAQPDLADKGPGVLSYFKKLRDELLP